MKRLFLAAGAATLCLVSFPSWSPSVGAGPVAESTVAVLANPDYVDAGDIADGGEMLNLVDDLEAGGHTVRQFTDISAEGITAALDGADALAIPELEADEFLYDDLTDEAAAVIRDFVDGGGRLLLFWAYDASAGLNDVFGFTTDTLDGCDDDGDEPCVLTATAAATEFADGPATLSGVNASAALLTSSLPEGSTVIYTGQEDDEEDQRDLAPAALVDVAAVAAVPFGDGAIITFGWDWFPDVETEEEGAPEAVGTASAEDEAGWATVLDLAASQPEVTASSPSAGQLLLTTDSPAVQPVFTAVVIAGQTTVVEIPAGSTSATLAVAGVVSVSYTVPGWGIGEGAVEVGSGVAAPAAPVPAAPVFTG